MSMTVEEQRAFHCVRSSSSSEPSFAAMLFTRMLGGRTESESPDLDKPVEISSRYNPNRHHGASRGAIKKDDNKRQLTQDKRGEGQLQQATKRGERDGRDDADVDDIPRNRGEVTIADKQTVKYSPSRSAGVSKAFQQPKRNYSGKSDGDWASQPQRSKSLFLEVERDDTRKENEQLTPGSSPAWSNARPVRTKTLLPQPKQPAPFKPPVSFKAKTLSQNEIQDAVRSSSSSSSSKTSSNQLEEDTFEEEASGDEPLDESGDLDIASHPSAIIDDSSIFERYSLAAEAEAPRRSARYDPPAITRASHSSTASPTGSISIVHKTFPCGSNSSLVQCTISRDRSSLEGRLYPMYTLVLEDKRKTMILARKMGLNRTSNYHLFDMTRGHVGQLSKKSGNYLGKLRARNSKRTEYVLLTKAAAREELAAVHFERLGMFDQLKEGSQPRRLTVLLPSLDAEGMPVPRPVGSDESQSLLEWVAAGAPPVKKDEGLYRLSSKDPVYENGNYRLNFRGRVTVPSVKNFQLVGEDASEVLCQFGKVGDDRFHLDYKEPLNAVQAFALALCQFNL